MIVIVLGDTGRSPRMQYHSMSIANMDIVEKVTIVGNSGEKCPKQISENPKIRDVRIDPVNIPSLKKIPLLHAGIHIFTYLFIFTNILEVCKGLLFLYRLFTLLVSMGHIDLIVIQNPPSTPAVIASWILSVFSKSVICLDWHNLGYSLYLDQHNESSRIVKLAKFLEKHVSKLCHKHICVSRTMQKWLGDNFSISCSVLYDRPPKSVFRRVDKSISEMAVNTIEMRHNLLMKLKLVESNLFPGDRLLLLLRCIDNATYI